MKANLLVSYLICVLVVSCQSLESDEDGNESVENSRAPAISNSTAASTTTSTTTTMSPSSTSPPSKSKLKPRPSPRASEMTCPPECSCVDKKLICEGKRLRTIPNLPKTSTFSDVSFKNNSIEVLDFNLLPLANIETLDLSFNSIKTITSPAKKVDAINKLKKINLSSNRLETLEGFSAWKFAGLNDLDFSANMIEDVGSQTFANLKSLTSLKINNTDLKTIHESAFSQLINLNSLYMQDTKVAPHLGDKQFAANQKLEFVDMSNNGLIEVPFALRSTTSIKTLILNENLMTSLRQSDFLNRSTLERLEIKRCNKLTKIDELTFSDLNKLQVLVITDNPSLQYISKDAFKSDVRHELDSIDFRGNNISAMSDPREFTSLSFKQILLSNNPWDCNCELKWIQSFDRQGPIHCKSPDKFKDMEVSQYFSVTDCELDTSYHTVIITGFLVFLLGLTVAVFVQKSEFCRHLSWKDQYGTIYYTKASFPPETV